ncbi:hypothetical protein CVT91_06295 [Candidatus Atribacteria bacterium HGW-Atribacteria-1]|nr:MAG: hypothetical protein CVT91_06295 [Candidatus Atribacteria bacterium HGW-Atribacteria-1]
MCIECENRRGTFGYKPEDYLLDKYKNYKNSGYCIFHYGLKELKKTKSKREGDEKYIDDDIQTEFGGEEFEEKFRLKTLERLERLEANKLGGELDAEECGKNYLFCWDDVPGNNIKLIKFLKDDLKIEWAENAEIKKSEDEETITVVDKNNNSHSLTIKLNKIEKKVTLVIDNNTCRYPLKEENDKLNIYDDCRLKTLRRLIKRLEKDKSGGEVKKELSKEIKENFEGEEFKKEFKNEFLKYKKELEYEEGKDTLNFEGFVFPEISFKNEKFEKDADFWNAFFAQDADFSKATFNKDADFSYVTFAHDADFSGATFVHHAEFWNTIIVQDADFSGATFMDVVFFDTIFKNNVNFGYTNFTNSLRFEGGRKRKEKKQEESEIACVDFSYARFLKPKLVEFINIDLSRVSFLNCRLNDISFSSDCKFNKKYGRKALREVLSILRKAVSERKALREVLSILRKTVSERKALREVLSILRKTAFGKIVLHERTVLYDEAILEKYDKVVEEYRNTKISKKDKKKKNNESAIKNYADIMFAEIKYHRLIAKIKDPVLVADEYREFRTNYENVLRYVDAGDFYIGEMEMRRNKGKFFGQEIKNKILKFLVKKFSPIAFYKYFSHYGENYWLALGWIIGIIIFWGLVWNSFDINNLNALIDKIKISVAIFFQMPPLQTNPPLQTSTPSYDPFYVVVERILGIIFSALFVIAIRRKFKKWVE